MRGVNSPLFTEGALIRDPRAVPNLCKADSGLSAMIGILAAIMISSHLVTREGLERQPRATFKLSKVRGWAPSPPREDA